MFVGIHVSNRQWRDPQISSGDLSLLRLMAPGVWSVKMMSYHRLSAWRSVDAILHPALWLVRLNDLSDLPNLATIHDAGYLAVAVEVGNEPNNPIEPWRANINLWAQWFDEATCWLREHCPAWAIATPGLSPTFDLDGWLTHPAFRGRAAQAHQVCAHGYYHDSITEAIEQVHKVQQRYPGKPILVSECCCTIGEQGPPRPTTTLAREYVEIAQRLAALGIEAVYYYILGSDDPYWERVGETFDETMARALGAIRIGGTTVDKLEAALRDIWQRQGVIPPADDGFWKYALAQAQAGKLVYPLPSKDGNWQNYDDPIYVRALTVPPLWAKKGEWTVHEGFPPF